MFVSFPVAFRSQIHATSRFTTLVAAVGCMLQCCKDLMNVRNRIVALEINIIDSEMKMKMSVCLYIH